MITVAQAYPAWSPLLLDEAEVLWRKLDPINRRVLQHLPPESVNVWLIGEHGQKPCGVVLLKDHRMAMCAIPPMDQNVPRLPKISFSAGLYSVMHALADLVIHRDEMAFCSAEGIRRLPEKLHELFLHHATKAQPVAKPVPTYESAKDNLTIGSAEAIAKKAYRDAFKRSHPLDATAFSNGWAMAALNFISGDESDRSLLAADSLHSLELMRTRNIHLAVSDLQSRRQKIDERLAAEEEITVEIAERGLEEDIPYLNARRTSTASFQMMRARALGGTYKNWKPFSQRFIKGMVLATAADARIRVGTLIDSISTSLAAHYGSALPLMQDVEIILAGSGAPELASRQEIGNATGIFVTAYPHGVVLDIPRIVLKSDVMMLDPRTIFHEFEHARQHLAAEGSIGDFQSTGKYETEIIEWQAKQAEADLTHQFGILY